MRCLCKGLCTVRVSYRMCSVVVYLCMWVVGLKVVAGICDRMCTVMVYLCMWVVGLKVVAGVCVSGVHCGWKALRRCLRNILGLE